MDARCTADAEARAISAPVTSEAEWSQWLEQAGLARSTLHELLSHTARLVVVAPHPDDELLACAGLMAAHADRGGRCVVVGVTDGEASHPGSRVWSAERLRRTRRDERERGLQALRMSGTDTVLLHFPDGDVASHTDALALRLETLLQADDVVVGTWRRDGHPDHDATGAACARACAAGGARLIQVPVWMWHWARPADPRVPWLRLHRLALTPALQARKRVAIACHVSQRNGGDAGRAPVLDAAILERANRPHEYLILAESEDATDTHADPDADDRCRLRHPVPRRS